MNILNHACVQGFIQLCQDGWELGYHERNGGNLTYRLTAEEAAALRPAFAPREWVPLGVTAPLMAGEVFLATGSGKFFQNVQRCPEESFCLLELCPKGDAYRILWGLTAGGVPTSELPAHILSHEVRARVTGGTTRVVYHAHPPALIALTFVLPLTDRAFTRALWQIMTECPVIFPRGLGVTPWMVPGGAQVAEATFEKLKLYDAVIWAQHGIFATGDTFDNTFGLLHAIEKSADIYLRAKTAGGNLTGQMTDQGFRDLAIRYNLPLDESFLGE